jgi:hypothetical protein
MIPSFTAEMALRVSTASNRSSMSRATATARESYSHSAVEAALPNNWPYDCGMSGCNDSPPDDSGQDYFSAYYECGSCPGGIFGDNPMYCLRDACDGCPGLAGVKCLSDFPPYTVFVHPTRYPWTTMPWQPGRFIR